MSVQFQTAVYVTSVALCIYYAWLGLRGIRGDFGNNCYPTDFIPAVAGFSVFPVINTAIAIVIFMWLLGKPSRDAERARAEKLAQEKLDAANEAFYADMRRLDRELEESLRNLGRQPYDIDVEAREVKGEPMRLGRAGW